MKANKKKVFLFLVASAIAGISSEAQATLLSDCAAPVSPVAPSVYASALRMSGGITGGQILPTTAEFQSMLCYTQKQDYQNAALVAAQSKYFANYLARRLAKQMQNPALDGSSVADNDATTFIVAHFTMQGMNGGSASGISSIWSENATYAVNVGGATTKTLDLSKAQLEAVDFTSQLVRTDGQLVTSIASDGQTATAAQTLPAQHVGGYTTLSDRATDTTSYASYGLLAGTNLRMIEGIWEISMGMTLTDLASADATAVTVPRFVPEQDPSFFIGQGQPACITCHGGGASSLNHGYSTVGDIFDFDTTSGLKFYTAPSTSTRKSLASDPNKRNKNNTCTPAQVAAGAVCNPDSQGTDPNQAWDVGATWGTNGVLAKMGWATSTVGTTGQGLNSLGAAIGKATLVYKTLAVRAMKEICPLGTFSDSDFNTIAQEGKTTDDMRVIVARIASNPSCR